VIRLPVVFGGSRCFEPRDPPIEKRVSVGELAPERLLHRSNGLGQRADPLNLLDGLQDRVDAISRRRLYIQGEQVPPDAVVEIDEENLLDHLVLPQIDLHVGDRQKQRVEDAPRRRVLACQRRADTTTQVLVDSPRVGVADAPRRLREVDDLVDDLGRGSRGTEATPGSGPAKKRVLERDALVMVDSFERLANERAELVGVERRECGGDIAAAAGLLPRKPLPCHPGASSSAIERRSACRLRRRL